MNSLDANTRNTKSKGDVRSLRLAGNIPGIIYGGIEQNQKVTILKKTLKSLIEKENFLSNIISLNLDGKPQNVLPKEITYNVISDEPSHIDFLRVVSGVKIRIEVPVQFINHEMSPGLKRGGVLSGEAVDRIKNSVIKNLVITDTIDNQNKIKNTKNIEVLPISTLMGEAIKRISNSTSVSDLFK